ncbi:glycosyltransferase [Georgenia sp. 10Sc9-8]|uniref:Glycosyltransferase n=1 Tax=Georgenia halotolerans TaxID=3028317 RepID=A0ABT5TXL1_9MICO|nr:glycosyltransferase [Georgenia halotolerans]
MGQGTRGIDPAWLGPRFDIFESVCAPSVLSQTAPDIEWLVFFDADTPEAYRLRATHLAEEFGFLPVWLSGEFTSSVAAREVVALLRPGDQRVITTRLDNDDALHPRYAEIVQDELGARTNGYVTFPFGAQLAAGEFFARLYPSNPFLSRVEAAQGEIGTVYAARHWLPREHRPKRIWTRHPAWLQVVHGANLANEVRGVWIRPSGPAQAFGVDAGDHEPAALGRARRRVISAVSLVGALSDRLAPRRRKTH